MVTFSGFMAPEESGGVFLGKGLIFSLATKPHQVNPSPKLNPSLELERPVQCSAGNSDKQTWPNASEDSHGFRSFWRRLEIPRRVKLTPAHCEEMG